MSWAYISIAIGELEAECCQKISIPSNPKMKFLCENQCLINTSVCHVFVYYFLDADRQFKKDCSKTGSGTGNQPPPGEILC